MEATHFWSGLMERMPTSKREFWLTLIRAVIVIGLIGAAARFVSIAYAPQAAVSPQQLSCPPDVATYREAIVAPHLPAASEQSAVSVAIDPALADISKPPSVIARTSEVPSIMASNSEAPSIISQKPEFRSLVAKKSELPSMYGKKEGARSVARKPPTYALARNVVLRKAGATA